MSTSSKGTTAPDEISIVDQRNGSRTRPERPTHRLRRRAPLRPTTTGEDPQAAATHVQTSSDVSPNPFGDGNEHAPRAVMRPSTGQDGDEAPSLGAWAASLPPSGEEYDEVLAQFLSDDDTTAPAAPLMSDTFGLSSPNSAPERGADVVQGHEEELHEPSNPVELEPQEPTGEEPASADASPEPGTRAVAANAPTLENTPPERATEPVQEAAPLGAMASGEPAPEREQPHPAGSAAQSGRELNEAQTFLNEAIPASRTRSRRAGTRPPQNDEPVISATPVPHPAAEVSAEHGAPVFVWSNGSLLSAVAPSVPTRNDHGLSNLDVTGSPSVDVSTTPAHADGQDAQSEDDEADVETAAGEGESQDLESVGTDDKPASEGDVPVVVLGAQLAETAPNQEVATAPTVETAAFVQQVRDAELRDAAPVLSPVHAVPTGGWRKAAMRLTLGRVQPTPSARQTEHDHEIYRVRTPLTGNRHIVVLAYGTGVGKTLTAGSIGLQFAVHRDDRVAVIDADQTAGNLADRFATPADTYLQNLLEGNAQQPVDSIIELRRFARSAKRLDIYTADHTRAFTAAQHRESLALLSRFHDIVVTDLGSSGLRDMPEVLDSATDVVIVTGTSMDAVDRSRKVLDRLEELGHERLAREAVVAMVTRTTKDTTLARAARNGGVHVETLIGHFQRRCRATVLVPYSARLADGVHVDYETIDAGVNDAYLRIAGYLANGFRPTPERATPQSMVGAIAPTLGTATDDLVSTPGVGGTKRRAAGRSFKRAAVKTDDVTTSSVFAELPHYRGR